MTYRNFIEALRKEVEKKAEPGIRVKLSQTEKNNGWKKDVLCLEEEGVAAVPAIYLESFYESYQDGLQLTDLAEKILEEYSLIRESARAFSPDCFLQFEQASSHIYCKLVHAKRNRELLKEIPWSPYLDLAETYYFELSDSAIPDGTIQITQAHLGIWEITERELKSIAWENTLRDKKAVFQELGEILNTMGVSCEIPREDGECLMYILSNTDTRNGAFSIRVPGILEEIARILEDDLYLIPSSIHEFLILKRHCGMPEEEINQLIHTVNREQVLPNEILSDHVYLYDRESNEVSIP